MADVDERIVQLTLDSKEFNRDTDTTIKSLDALKESLKFEGIGKGFDEITRAADKVNLNPISYSVQKVSNQFDLLTTVADTFFRNIVNNAVNAGERMIKSLSVDQITTGWAKYAEQTGAVQTIMAATAQQFDDTAVQMETVNEQLEKLTWFTDETSHKFNDMVSGIGKFTANNIDLDTSVKAMEGIATWASLSGANTNEASRAIYNLAQAISVGTVKLIDWRSIENANMGTTEFKRTVIETAEEMGTLIKVADDLWSTLDGKGRVSTSNFSEELSKGWFTSDVLLKSLEAYGGFADQLNQFVDETGILTATAMNYIDDYVEETLNMTEATQATGLSAEKLIPWLEKLGSEENELGRRAFRAAQETKTFQEAIDYVKEAVSSGWSTSFKFIFGDYLEAKEWWSEIAETMYDVFVIGGEIRNTILGIWKEEGGRKDFLDGIRALIENVKGLLDIFSDAWNETFFGEGDKQLENRANMLLSLTEGFKRFAEAIKPTEDTAKNLKDILKTVFGTLRSGMLIIKSVTKALSPLGSLLNVIAGSLLQVIGDIARLINSGLERIFTAERLEKLSSGLNTIARILSVVIQISLVAIFELTEKLINSVGNLFNRFKENGGGIQGIFITLKEAVMAFWNSFMEGTTIANTVVDVMLLIFGGLVAGVKTIISTVIDLLTGELTLDELFNGNGGLSDGVSGFSKLLERLNLQGVLSNIVDWIRTFIDNLSSADSVLVTFINNVADSLTYLGSIIKRLFDTITIGDVKDLLLIAILWNFVSSLKAFNVTAKGLVANVSGIFGTFNNVLKTLTGQAPVIDKLNTMFQRTTFLQMGIAVALIVNALGELNKLDWAKTQQSVAALGSAMAIFFAAIAVMNKLRAKKTDDSVAIFEGITEIVDNFGRNILKISAGIFLVVQALKGLNEVLYDAEGNLDVTRIAASIGAIVVILSALTGAVVAMNKIETNAVSVGPIIALAAGMMLVTNSLKALATVESGPLLAATLAVGGVIVALGGAVRIMSQIDWKTALSTVPLVLSFSTAVTELALAIGVLVLIDKVGDIGNALGALALSLAGITAALALLGKTLKKVKASRILSIGAAFVEIGTAMVILAGALKLMEGYDIDNSIGGLIALGGSFVVISTALGVLSKLLKDVKPQLILSIGTALLEFSVSIVALAGALKIIEGVKLSNIWEGVTVIGVLVVAFGALEVALVSLSGNGVFAEGIAEMLDALGNSFLKFGIAVLAISAGIALLQTSFTAFGALVIALQGFADKVGLDLPSMITRGFETIELIIREFLEMIRNLAPDILITVAEIIGLVAAAMELKKREVSIATIGLVLAIADTVVQHAQDIIDAIVAVINIINSSTELFTALTDLVYNIAEFLGASLIGALCGLVYGAGKGLLNCFGMGWSDGAEEAAEVMASNMSGPLADHIEKMGDEELSDAARTSAYNATAGLVAGWAEGSVKLEDEAIISALRAMNEFEQTAAGSGKDSMNVVLDKIKEGVDEISPELADLFKELGREDVAEAMGEGADPDSPWDFGYNAMTGDMIDWFKAAYPEASEQLNLLFGGLGEGAAGSFTDTLISGLNKYGYGTNLFTGFGRKGSIKVSKEQKARADEARKKQNDLFGFSDEDSKEIQNEYEDQGYNAGNAYDLGVGKGISGSGASKSAAKTKANEIADAYTSAISNIDLSAKTASLEYELWEAMNPDADEVTKQQKKIEYSMLELEFQTQRVEAASEQYNKTLAEMGEQAEETTKALHTLREAQIKLYQLQNNLNELQGTSASSESADKFREASSKYHKILSEMGGDISENIMKGVWNNVMKEAGLNQYVQVIESVKEQGEGITNAIADGVLESMPAALETVAIATDGIGNVIATFANKDLPNSLSTIKVNLDGVITDSFSSFGDTAVDAMTDAVENYIKPNGYTLTYAVGTYLDEGLGDGTEDSVEIAEDAIEFVSKSVISNAKETLGVKSPSTVFYYIGEMIVAGLSTAIEDGRSTVVNKIVSMIEDAIAAAKAAAGIHSPSTEGAYIGEMFVLGIAQGTEDYAYLVREGAAQVITDSIADATEEATTGDLIGKYISDTLNGTSAVITLDVDTTILDQTLAEYQNAMTDYKSKAARIIKATEESQEGRILQIAKERGGGLTENERDIADSLRRKEYLALSMLKGSDLELISRQLQVVAHLLETQQINKDIQTKYDTSDIIVNFNQTNTSPKALSRLDIYRDTQKQLNSFYDGLKRQNLSKGIKI